jgi:hypothetical protein
VNHAALLASGVSRSSRSVREEGVGVPTQQLRTFRLSGAGCLSMYALQSQGCHRVARAETAQTNDSPLLRLTSVLTKSRPCPSPIPLRTDGQDKYRQWFTHAGSPFSSCDVLWISIGVAVREPSLPAPQYGDALAVERTSCHNALCTMGPRSRPEDEEAYSMAGYYTTLCRGS